MSKLSDRHTPGPKFRAVSPEKLIATIESRWESFAEFAWESYLRKGRGAVLVTLNNGDLGGNGRYMPADSPPEAWPDLGYETEIQAMMAEYDPPTTIAFVVNGIDPQDPRDCGVFTIQSDPGLPTPPDVYISRHPLN
jgi:hypothetical protein